METKKLDMALEQLEDSLKMYFNGHYHSSIVLSGAAEQLLTRHKKESAHEIAKSCLKSILSGLDNHYDNEPKSDKKYKKEATDILNKTYNNAKHKRPGDTLYSCPKFDAQQVISRALTNLRNIDADELLPDELEYEMKFYREQAKSE